MAIQRIEGAVGQNYFALDPGSYVSGQTRWSSAFRLFRAENMLKHELQPLAFAEEKTLPWTQLESAEILTRKHRKGC